MRNEALAEAITLSQTALVLVATADERGLPHVAAADALTAAAEGGVKVTEWLCRGTMENLDVNRRVALVVWDDERDSGYQLLGSVERIEEVGVLDGLSPGDASHRPVPQAEHELLVRVERVLDFSRAPHADVEG